MTEEILKIPYDSFTNTVVGFVERIEEDIKVQPIEVLMFCKKIELVLNIPKAPNNVTKQIAQALGHSIKDNKLQLIVKADSIKELPNQLKKVYNEFKVAVTKVMEKIREKD